MMSKSNTGSFLLLPGAAFAREETADAVLRMLMGLEAIFVNLAGDAGEGNWTVRASDPIRTAISTWIIKRERRRLEEDYYASLGLIESAGASGLIRTATSTGWASNTKRPIWVLMGQYFGLK